MKRMLPLLRAVVKFCSINKPLTKDIETNYLLFIHTMLATNCNNFETFRSPYCLLSNGLTSINNPLIYATLSKMSTPFVIMPLLFGAGEYIQLRSFEVNKPVSSSSGSAVTSALISGPFVASGIARLILGCIRWCKGFGTEASSISKRLISCSMAGIFISGNGVCGWRSR